MASRTLESLNTHLECLELQSAQKFRVLRTLEWPLYIDVPDLFNFDCIGLQSLNSGVSLLLAVVGSIPLPERDSDRQIRLEECQLKICFSFDFKPVLNSFDLACFLAFTGSHSLQPNKSKVLTKVLSSSIYNFLNGRAGRNFPVIKTRNRFVCCHLTTNDIFSFDLKCVLLPWRWWWSSGQRACLQLRRTEVESH